MVTLWLAGLGYTFREEEGSFPMPAVFARNSSITTYFIYCKKAIRFVGYWISINKPLMRSSNSRM
jgi:hypothetical protein